MAWDVARTLAPKAAFIEFGFRTWRARPFSPWRGAPQTALEGVKIRFRCIAQRLAFGKADQKVRPATGERFTTKEGALWPLTHLSSRMGTAVKAAARALYNPEPGREPSEEQKRHKARLGSIPARKLRAAFATLASQRGAQDRIFKAYLGHTPGDILGGHYRRVDMDELRLVSSLMDGSLADPQQQKGEVSETFRHISPEGPQDSKCDVESINCG